MNIRDGEQKDAGGRGRLKKNRSVHYIASEEHPYRHPRDGKGPRQPESGSSPVVISTLSEDVWQKGNILKERRTKTCRTEEGFKRVQSQPGVVQA